MGRAILVDRRAHSKVYAVSAMSFARTAEQIDLPFGLCTAVGGSSMHKFSRIRQVAPMCALMGGHIAAT